MSDRKQIRHKTALEEELEKEPRCLHDPAKVAHCTNHEFPPKTDMCERCLTNSVLQDLENDCPSEALRWFIAYKSFHSVDAK